MQQSPPSRSPAGASCTNATEPPSNSASRPSHRDSRLTDRIRTDTVAVPQFWGHTYPSGQLHARRRPGANVNRLHTTTESDPFTGMPVSTRGHAASQPGEKVLSCHAGPNPPTGETTATFGGGCDPRPATGAQTLSPPPAGLIVVAATGAVGAAADHVLTPGTRPGGARESSNCPQLVDKGWRTSTTDATTKCRSGRTFAESPHVAEVSREVWGTEGPGFESRQPDHQKCRSVPLFISMVESMSRRSCVAQGRCSVPSRRPFRETRDGGRSPDRPMGHRHLQSPHQESHHRWRDRPRRRLQPLPRPALDGKDVQTPPPPPPIGMMSRRTRGTVDPEHSGIRAGGHPYTEQFVVRHGRTPRAIGRSHHSCCWSLSVCDYRGIRHGTCRSSRSNCAIERDPNAHD